MERIDFRSFVFSGVVTGFNVRKFWGGGWVVVRI